MRRTTLALLAGFSIAGAAAAQEAVVTQQSPDELLGGWVLGSRPLTESVSARLMTLQSSPEKARLMLRLFPLAGFWALVQKALLSIGQSWKSTGMRARSS
nr:hypothetical protein [Roseinatronobacter monicus]